jgi:hypothetical protein
LYEANAFLCYRCMDYGCDEVVSKYNYSPIVSQVQCNTSCFVRLLIDIYFYNLSFNFLIFSCFILENFAIFRKV